MSTTAQDEFDALRTVVKSVESFGPDDQNRILRWAAEKLGLSQSLRPTSAPPSSVAAGALPSQPAPTAAAGGLDIKAFVAQKKPKNDSQFAAVVAYYHRFEAPEKKDTITKADLLNACRLANYKRPPSPGQTLRNALNAGLLDKRERGAFSVNSVGENLVAVTLPGDGAALGNPGSGQRSPRKKRPRNAKKPSMRKATANE